MGEYIKYNIVEIAVVVILLSIVLALIFYFRDKNNKRKASFYFSHLFYKLGITKRMSRSYVSLVHVKECYEPLVDLVKHPKIFVSDDTVEHPVLVRKSVAMKLYKIADDLPDDVYLKFYGAFRSRIAIYDTWKKELEVLSGENPHMNRAELIELTNRKVPSPNIDMGGHDTGAAVDVALCDVNRNDLDFGTKYYEKRRRVSLTKEQKENRKMLKSLMKSQDFVNMPGQWWHFSYGDKMWSAYKGKRLGAFYGHVEKEFENMGYVKVVKTEIKSANIK